MESRTGADPNGQLPAEWLPAPRAPEGAAEWEPRVARIMRAADPELRGLRSRRAATRPQSWLLMARWWKLAGALTAAATALLLLNARSNRLVTDLGASLPLSMVAAEGDPVTLWTAYGIEADPVLALIAAQMLADATGAEPGPDVQQGGGR